MVKAKKAKSAKSKEKAKSAKSKEKAKSAKSKEKAKSAKSKAANASVAAATAPAAMVAQVAIVTPGTESTASIDAFKDELKNFGYPPNTTIAVFSAADKSTTLDYQVGLAVGTNPPPKVIIAAGSVAAQKVQASPQGQPGAATPIAIIQAAGGEIPAKQANLTGFTINALKIARDHVESLLTAGKTLIAVIYDNANTPSANAANKLSTLYKNLLLVPKTDPTTLTSNDLKDSGGHSADGVVLISNAVYYKHAQDIVNVLDNLNPMPTIYYPEREFKSLHQNRATVHVHGHNIPLTYRQSAWYAASILKNDWTPTTLPDFKEAITDED